jgi:hypothetical protein
MEMGRMVRPHFAIHANNDPVEATEFRHSYSVQAAPSNVSFVPRTIAISGSRPKDYPHRRILSRVRCIALFGENIRVSSVLGFKLEMKFGLFLKTCFDKSLPDRRCDLKELRLRKRRMPVMLKTDQAKTVANVEEIVLAISHSPAMYLKAHGLGGHTSRICLVTAGVKHIFVFWIERQLYSKKCDE